MDIAALTEGAPGPASPAPMYTVTDVATLGPPSDRVGFAPEAAETPAPDLPEEKPNREEWLRGYTQLDQDMEVFGVKFRRKSAEVFIQKGEWVVEAERLFEDKKEDLDWLKEQVGKATWSKHRSGGNAAPRLRPLLNRLPAGWTLLYQLTRLKPADFEMVTRHSLFGPELKTHQLKAMLGRGPKSKKYLVANVTKCSPELIAEIEALLKERKVEPKLREVGAVAVPKAEGDFHMETAEAADV